VTTHPRVDRDGRRSRTGWWFAAFTVACLGGAGAYVLKRSPATAPPPAATTPALAPSAQQAELDEIRRGPHVYFRSVRASEFGKVVVATMAAPNEQRVVTSLACDRLDFGRNSGVCLVDNRGRLGAAGLAHLVDRDLRVRHTVDLAGFPIRARLSPDERYAVATVFVTGESYESDFTTRTTIIDMQTGAIAGDLEQYETRRDQQRFSRVDFNFWGVTFRRDGRSFYATLGTAGSRYLVGGNVVDKHMNVVGNDVECPSLSPDDQYVVFKNRVAGSRGWRLHALDVQSGRRWPIAESRSVDDQVEWLDDAHVLYQIIENRGLPEDAVHVWTSTISSGDTTPPAIYIRSASSPAVVP
jgi:hypothetical protein